MILKKVVEISLEEAQQLLTDWRVKFLSENPDKLNDIVTCGFSKLKWSNPVNQLTIEHIAFAIAETDIGKIIADQHQADLVIINKNKLNAMIIYDSSI